MNIKLLTTQNSIKKEDIKTKSLYKEYITDKNKFIKYTINIIMILGSIGFLNAGISSYLQYDLIPFLKTDQIIFFPQGLVMCFYGTAGLLIGTNQMKILLLKIGEGYNEFNKQDGTMTMFRKGIKGKNSDINITYSLKDILRIKNL